MLINLLSLMILFFLLYWLIDVIHGNKLLSMLPDSKLKPTRSYPKLSIILAARNEETTIQLTVESLLSQNYPLFELIVVNDRSTDATQKILNRFKKKYSNLIIKEITTLPTGWFGKNHALHQGAKHATGNYLLFSDADIIFKQETLSSTMNFLLENNLSYLTLIPKIKTKDFTSTMVILSGFISFLYLRKPWKAIQEHQPNSAAMGAFILLKKQHYEAAGGFKSVKASVIDDLAFGQKVKELGIKQACLNGHNKISVEWYPSFKTFVKGIEKNLFAYYQFKLSKVILSTLFGVTYAVLPIVLFISHSSALSMLINALSMGVTGFGYSKIISRGELPSWYAAFYWYGALFTISLTWHAAYKIKRQGHLVWRDRTYALDMIDEYTQNR